MTFGEINEDIIQVGSLVQFYFVDFRIKKVNWGQPREFSAAPTLNRISGFFYPTLKTREWKRTAFVANDLRGFAQGRFTPIRDQ